MAEAKSDGRPRRNLVAAIYDAAADHTLWTGIAGRFAAAFGSDQAVVWSVDKGRVAANPSSTFAESYHAPYRDYYHHLDPWFAFSRQRVCLKTWLGSDIISERAFQDSEFYIDYSRHFGACHAALSNFMVSPRRLGCINIMRARDASPFDGLERRRLDRLLPHLQRAFQIKARLDSERLTGVGFAALDALIFGTLVCDQEGRVLFANSAAETLAKSSGALKVGGHEHGVSLPVREENRQLRRLIFDAAQGGAGGGMRTSAGDGPVLLILVAPMPQRFTEDGAKRRLVLVAIRAADDWKRLSTATVGAIFGLTSAEADLALALFQDRSLADVMAEKSIAESTVRTQLTRVLHKADCRNQRELVNLIGRLPQLR